MVAAKAPLICEYQLIFDVNPFLNRFVVHPSLVKCWNNHGQLRQQCVPFMPPAHSELRLEKGNGMNYGELMDPSDGRISLRGRQIIMFPPSFLSSFLFPCFPPHASSCMQQQYQKLQTLRKETKQNKLVPFYFSTDRPAREERRDSCKTRSFQPSTFSMAQSRLSYDPIFVVLHHSGHFHCVPASLIRSGDLQFYFYPLLVLCFSLGAYFLFLCLQPRLACGRFIFHHISTSPCLHINNLFSLICNSHHKNTLFS